MTRSFLLSAAIFALGVSAQQSSAYTDENTGITFQSYFDKSGFSFGIALPDDSTTDFIGQLVTPVTEGWGGMTFGSGMANHLMVVAWPNGNQIIGSLREATSYATPPVFTGDASLETITKGTFTNSTAFSYTFLCKGCITGDDKTFTSNATSGVFGWAYSDSAVTTPTSASSALSYHSAGFGLYGVNFSAAKSTNFASWAALASAGNSTGGGNSTTTPGSGNGSPGTNGTAPGTNTTVPASNATYDYIVAGAGAAGIIVAERLAESGASVLLLERGEASTFSSGGKAVVAWNSSITQYDVPGYAYYLSSMKDTSEYCTDTASQAGCLLGGGSMVNALMFVRPQDADFDDKWPTGWKWSDVESAADRLYERNPGTTLASMDGKRYDQAAYDVLSSFFSGMGYKSVDSIKQPNEKHDVFSYPAWSIQNGLRAGPVRNYLPLAQQKSNFKLQLNTKVIRAVRTSSTITGVEIEDSTGARQIVNVKANGKVILSSGALSTPRILFNSGIGPVEQIQTVASGSTGVTLPEKSAWINLPVGQGVQDHPIFTLKFTVNGGLSALSASDFTTPSSANVDLFAQGSGLLAQSGQRINFWTSAQGSDGVTRYFQGTCNGPSNNTVQIKLYLTHGLTSSGTLGITPEGVTQFTTQPWLTTDADKDAAAAMIDRLLAATRASNSSLTFLPTSGNSSSVTGADLIKTYVTGAHFVGTARMGTDDGRTNGTAVVDSDTKVYGTDNLFVVDASMHPDLPTGNTQAIVMVAAEAAAARILALGGGSSSINSTTGIGAQGGSSQTSAIAAATPTIIASATGSATFPQPTSGGNAGLPSSPGGDDDGDDCDDVEDEPTSTSTTSFSSSTQSPTPTPASLIKVRNEAPIVVAKRQSLVERRLLSRSSNPERLEDEDEVLKRVQWEKASFLDGYKN